MNKKVAEASLPPLDSIKNGGRDASATLNRGWLDIDAILVILCSLFLAFGTIFSILAKGRLPHPTHITIKHIPVLFLMLLVAFAITIARSHTSNIPVAKLLQIQKERIFVQILRGICIAVPISVFSFTISYFSGILYTKVTGFAPEVQTAIMIFFSGDLHPIVLAALLISIVFTNPIAEEILFRSILMQTLREKHTALFAVISSSVFFGLLHFHIVHLPSLIFIGIALSITLLKTKSLITTVTVHSTFNAITMLLVVSSS